MNLALRLLDLIEENGEAGFLWLSLFAIRQGFSWEICMVSAFSLTLRRNISYAEKWHLAVLKRLIDRI